MLGRNAEDIQRLFFSLENWSDLRNFLDCLDLADPSQAALHYYANTWVAPEDSRAHFEPSSYISSDLSAIYYGRCPVIFEGSNQWARKSNCSRSYYDEKLQLVYLRCRNIRQINPLAKMCLVLVPEKDFLISTVFLKENRFDNMRAAVSSLQSRLKSLDIPVIFEQPIRRMAEFQTLKDFEYPDSHLMPRNYVVIFSHVLANLGFNWNSVAPLLGMERRPVYLDLTAKFKDGVDQPINSFELNFVVEGAQQVAGSKTFSNPLEQTRQVFANDTSVFPEDILVLGDSHCSIYSQRRMTYLFANAFRRTAFSWNPSGIRPDEGLKDCRYIALEISSRFVF
jgi:hypothetical protein